MTTITDLSQILNSWIRRLRLQRALVWSSRGLILGLALSLVLGGIGLYRAELPRGEFLALVIFTPLLICSIAAVIAWLWPVRPLQAARYFDQRFRLKERVSTALELNQRSESILPEMIDRQLQDAVAASNQVNLRRDLPFRYHLWEGVVTLLFVVLIGMVWFRGESWFLRGQQSRAVEQAVEEQTTKIEEIIKQIEANEALSETQKEA
ncbi:MAG TPA: hypothetical protein VFQ13_25780, partial [Anaerolineales bacterium]|nr:hypothetical protein [Anaerolineales bacterium]